MVNGHWHYFSILLYSLLPMWVSTHDTSSDYPGYFTEVVYFVWSASLMLVYQVFFLTPFFSIWCQNDLVDDRGTERESKKFNWLLHWLLTDENVSAYTNSWKTLSLGTQCQNANICLVGFWKNIEVKYTWSSGRTVRCFFFP